MSKVIKLKKGLDIKLTGEADNVVVQSHTAETYSVKPADFMGIVPKLLVKAGDRVKAGTAVMFDKYRPDLLFVSPVSGTVKEIVRGEKRKILDVLITPDANTEYEQFEIPGKGSLDAGKIKELMLKAGLWPMMIQRPYGIIASEKDTPRGIYVSLFDSAPLAPNLDLIIDHSKADFAAGLEVLKTLSGGKLFLGAGEATDSAVKETAAKAGEVTVFSGKHPVGCVGVQIANTQPIAKGEILWTIDPQAVIILGRFFTKGIVDMSKVIALCGSEVTAPKYYKTVYGADVKSIVGGNIKEQQPGNSVRIIDGNVLTGTKTDLTGHFGFYKNQITVIPEGDKYEMFGWIAPRFHKFSVSHSYFSWLTPSKKYTLDTNQNGGHRALVMTGEYEKVVPMDIYPVFLLKAILANDIDKMENLGIYEVIEEDLALCEFVCTSKTDVQQILRQGIETMIKELN